MSLDIGNVLSGWDFQPDDLQVRLIAGDDGREKIQMRVDLGVLQMECEGRPDGRRPHGVESLLEYHEARRQEAIEAGEEFALHAVECAALMREGLQYYHRYLSAFHLQLYDMVARDTERNLRLFAFVSRHAARNRDRIEFDQYRPYVTMMLTRALAIKEMGRGDLPAALERIDEGVRRIREFLLEYRQDDRETECSELNFLLRWRADVSRERPTGPLEVLEHRLQEAVARESYEEAGRLRDQIAQIKAAEPSEPSERRGPA
ncbi:UvrB/UvrC motif-containing protein [Planctomyces sp. SH-PL62]|uniref:UvrB/UvrC motif-containing protein n=1 Tax=Planctomyces sp. SH-PL62 TaxID=1636152 RepID=UPI00078E3412|nr:UvrB/UvrC motif-containing protein [Planctomyces sp. SH-PL62]AMV36692.1 UvrB/uvrC motif protein [Planctomyces sp. SH-PL62]